MATSVFIDRVTLHVRAGSGGDGCTSIRREKFRPLGGPDGGNGGHGGDVVLQVDSNVHTLLDFHFHPHVTAPSGGRGQGSLRHGAQGEEHVVAVPSGTVVKTVDGEVLTDLVGAGSRFVIAKGGCGGLGNAALASPRRKAPHFSLLGEAGEERDVVVELKSIADVGLVGFPSAGKSSLISVMSAARPKIADYPFTTLAPNLGVVQAGETTFTVADVPGLIPGAAAGKGLGLEFLRHVERCAVLVHVVDMATIEPGRDPLSDIEAVEAELAAYGGLEAKPRFVVLNKVDVPEARELVELVRGELEEKFNQPRGEWETPQGAQQRVFGVSAATQEGVRGLVYALGSQVEVAREVQVADASHRAQQVIVRPEPVDRAEFSVEKDPSTSGGFLVRGDRPERWVRQTDFSNEEAVTYLADRLARLGVEDVLRKAGAEPGASVTIGGFSFDWIPSNEK